MNNIEILGEFIKYFEAEATQRKYKRNISITVGEDDIEAIENLIQENKELRIQISARETVVDKLAKENKELKEKLQQYKKIEEIANTITDDDIKNAIKNAEKDYIPKSKVKAKIEKLEKEKCGLTINICSRNQGKTFQQTLIDHKIKVLKELLEEGE